MRGYVVGAELGELLAGDALYDAALWAGERALPELLERALTDPLGQPSDVAKSAVHGRGHDRSGQPR